MRSLYKIYKPGDEENYYIGSTVDMTVRAGVHKGECKNSNTKLYKYIRENGGWESFTMEKFGECEFKEEEYALIRRLRPPLNTVMYDSYFDRKGYLKAYCKNYREKNKEQIKVYQKDYQQEYRQKNKEHIKAYQRQQRQDNIEKMKDYQIQYNKYQSSWGGDKRCNNNLLKINPNLFD